MMTGSIKYASVVVRHVYDPLVINSLLGTRTMNKLESEHAASGYRFEEQD